MTNYNRQVKQYYLDKSKHKVIESVMNEIHKDSVFERVMQYKTLIITSLMMATLVLVAFF